MNNQNSFESHIQKWIENISILHPEIGGFSICPYAKGSKYKILRESIENLKPEDGYDAIIFGVDNSLSIDDILSWIAIYNSKYSDWKFFEDHRSYNTYINGIQTNNGKYNLIIAQPKEKLKKFRQILSKTNYYNYWSKDYLNEILEEDIHLFDKG
jgi:hypothetical protein